jgi:protein phosphatase
MPKEQPTLNFCQRGQQQSDDKISYWPKTKEITVDPGSLLQTDPIYEGRERWAADNSTVLTNSSSIAIQLYHQFSLYLSYKVVYGENVTAPFLDAKEFGTQVSSQLLPGHTLGLWLDEDSPWRVNQTLPGSTDQERWFLNSTNNGTISSWNNYTLTYFHQYLLRTIPQPLSGGTTTPGGDWCVAGDWCDAGENVTISATAQSGFTFSQWECTPLPSCYQGKLTVVLFPIYRPTNETAIFNREVNVTIVGLAINGPLPYGKSTLFVSVNNQTTQLGPGGNSSLWNSNEEHTLHANASLPCLPAFVCYYVFAGWIMSNGIFREGQDLTIVNASSNETIVAVWRQEFGLFVWGIGFVPFYDPLLVLFATATAVSLAWRKRKPAIMPPRETAMTLQGYGPSGVRCRVGALSDRGGVRADNEDSILTFETLGAFESVEHNRILCAVADGVGGSSKGEVASKLALQTLASEATKALLAPDADLGAALRSSIEAANEAVVKYGMEHRESEGLATTIVSSIISGNLAYVAHAGDSRAYLINRAEVRALTKDHSQVQELVDAGQIKADQTRSYPGRNVITRAVGAATDIEVTLSQTDVEPGDRIVLCCDGLWEPVLEDELQKVVLESKDPQTACARLVELAKAHGGRDNISVVIVELEAPVIGN